MSDAHFDVRLQRLSAWTRDILKRDDLAITVASADASFRRYFRATAPLDARGARLTWIVMDAPPEKEDVGPYIHVADMLVRAGVNAPRVLAQNLEEGFLLLSDLGTRTYLMELQDAGRADVLYGDALRALVTMQAGCHEARELPPYGPAMLAREMELFPEWFLTKHLGLTVDAATRALLDKTFDALMASALAQPRVFVHRDYHSRNLMATSGVHGANPGVLDFQDGVYGPVTYDLVSLLRDCYIAWPMPKIQHWVREYRSAAQRAQLEVGASEAEFMRWFDLMGVQRHLKAIGIFARLWHRDGKPGYLGDIPRTLDYIRDVAPHHAELGPLLHFIEAHVVPALVAKSQP